MAHTVTIELPDMFQVERSGTAIDVESAMLSADMIAQLVVHGIVQKIGDDVAGAVAADYEEHKPEGAKAWEALSKTQKTAWKDDNATRIADRAKGDMEAVRDRLYADDWGKTRGTGSGLTALDRKMMSVDFFKVPGKGKLSARAIVKMRDKDAYSGMEQKDRDNAVMEFLGTLPAEHLAALRSEAERIMEAEKSEVSVEITL